jgi:hypothetical protein
MPLPALHTTHSESTRGGGHPQLSHPLLRVGDLALARIGVLPEVEELLELRPRAGRPIFFRLLITWTRVIDDTVVRAAFVYDALYASVKNNLELLPM